MRDIGVPYDDGSEESILARVEAALESRFMGTPMTSRSLADAQALVNSISAGRVPIIVHVSRSHQSFMVCHKDRNRNNVEYCDGICDASDCSNRRPKKSVDRPNRV